MSSVCNLQIGLANSTPRLLIATDSKRWFVSQAEVRRYGEYNPERKSYPTGDPFIGTGEISINTAYSSNDYSMSSANENLLNQYSKILHELLFKSIKKRQMQFLLQFPENEVYVNPNIEKNKLLVCICKPIEDINQYNGNQKFLFLLVDKYAGTHVHFPTHEITQREILPNLVKVNVALVNEFLAREAF